MLYEYKLPERRERNDVFAEKALVKRRSASSKDRNRLHVPFDGPGPDVVLLHRKLPQRPSEPSVGAHCNALERAFC